MKEQYVGDINDFWKYCLLRQLALNGPLRIGVCWMMTPNDKGPDGRNIQYLREPAFYEVFDQELFQLLRRVVDVSDSSRLKLIEDSGIIPGAIYCDTTVPDASVKRQMWFEEAMSKLNPAELLFFDPDNGLNVPTRPMGRKWSSKYLFRDEVTTAYNMRRSVLIYQHYPRENRDDFVRRTSAELVGLMPTAKMWAFKSAHVAYFMGVHPDHLSKINSAATTIAQNFGPQYSTADPGNRRRRPIFEAFCPN